MALVYFAAADLTGFLDAAATDLASAEHSAIWHCPS